MWLITPVGFFSIVQKSEDQLGGTLTVRSRIFGDLVALQQHYLPELGPIEESTDTDYRFRAIARRADVAAAMTRIVEDLNYSNFKSQVSNEQGVKRSGLYHKVWDVLHKLQTDPAFAEKVPAADSYGGVVVSGGNRVLLRKPTHQHGGYAWTFAKTLALPGESPREAAVRAVLEKTGYDATIRISIAGLFVGSSSNTCYYVMDAIHPPVKANWQTSELRWVRFEEARDLIRQSPNAKGRDRDLTILDAAIKAAALIAYRDHPNVQPEDWSIIKAMPERRIVLYPKKSYFAEEMELIRRGFYPTVQEQKWFMYFTGDRLKMHRSWTGFLVFDVRFSVNPDGSARVTEVIVNREPRQYSSSDEDKDLRHLDEMIRIHLLQPLDEPEVDGFVKAMALATQPKYLGSPVVVAALVKEVVSIAIRAFANEATEDDIHAVVEKVVSAYTDDEAGYTRMPAWHSAKQMGSYIKTYLTGLEDGTSLAEIISSGMHALINKLQEILLNFVKDPAATWEEHAVVQLNALQQFVVTVLLGTNTVISGSKTLSDFHWEPVSTAPAGKQVILELNGDDSVLILYGILLPTGWQFRIATQEADELDDEVVSIPPKAPWVGTWRSALKRLDAFPWTQLHSVTVHPEFRMRVFKALQTRKAKGGLAIDWDQWGDTLNILIDEG